MTRLTQPGGPQLIAYADRLGGSIDSLRVLLEGPLTGVFSGVHLLPFFTPYDGADAGFDPRDHSTVDPRLGTWADVRALGAGHVVVADVIVNHMSVDSAQFEDVRRRGRQSLFLPMFLTFASVFPKGASESELARIYRPRPGLPFTTVVAGDERRLFWTTFTPSQIDINLRQPAAWDYITSVIDVLVGAGVSVLRLDAIGYVGKEAGTDCFMTESAVRCIGTLSEYAHARGASVLVEVHGHFSNQVSLAEQVDYVYDFALPPLLLHALTTGDLGPLADWVGIRPSNAMTVLDTHDGIGVIDVAPHDGRPGLLTAAQIDALVEGIHLRSGGSSRLATGEAASNLDTYQVNCTFYDALGRDDARFLLARLIQLFLPGVPQVYYVGLLAGTNDVALLGATGVGRDINRHCYSSDEIEPALARPLVQAQMEALRFRRDHPAFLGHFSASFAGSRGELTWRNAQSAATLRFDALAGRFEMSACSGESTRVLVTDKSLSPDRVQAV